MVNMRYVTWAASSLAGAAASVAGTVATTTVALAGQAATATTGYVRGNIIRWAGLAAYSAPESALFYANYPDLIRLHNQGVTFPRNDRSIIQCHAILVTHIKNNVKDLREILIIYKSMSGVLTCTFVNKTLEQVALENNLSGIADLITSLKSGLPDPLAPDELSHSGYVDVGDTSLPASRPVGEVAAELAGNSSSQDLFMQG